jgi:acetone carboxylase gamma subunit
VNSKAYLKIFAYNDKDELIDIKVIKITKEGEIIMEEAIGQPQRENVTKDKPEYIESDIKVESQCPSCGTLRDVEEPCPKCVVKKDV